MTKKARLSTFTLLAKQIDEYVCKQAWPEDCFVQAGDRGVVFTSKGNYQTAFFEAFPRTPDTFIRGEGKTIEEAEEHAWKQYSKQIACVGHEFERRNYTNGAGFCKHCNFFKSKAFEPSTKCVKCNKPTDWSVDKKNNWYCEDHGDQNPDKIEW